MFKRSEAPGAAGTEAFLLRAATEYAAALRQVFDSAEEIRIEKSADGDYYKVTVPVSAELFEDTDRRLEAERSAHEAIGSKIPAAVGRVAIRYRPT